MLTKIFQDPWRSIGLGVFVSLIFIVILLIFGCNTDRIGSINKQFIVDDGELRMSCATYYNIPFLCLWTIDIQTKEQVEVKVPIEVAIKPVIEAMVEEEPEPEVVEEIVQEVAEALKEEPEITVEEFVETSIEVIEDVYYGEDVSPVIFTVKDEPTPPTVTEDVPETLSPVVIHPTPPMVENIIEEVEEIIEESVSSPTPTVVEPAVDEEPEADEESNVVVIPATPNLQAHIDARHHPTHGSGGLHSHERIIHRHGGFREHTHLPFVHRHITPYEDEPDEILTGYVATINCKDTDAEGDCVEGSQWQGGVIHQDYIEIEDIDGRVYIWNLGADKKRYKNKPERVVKVIGVGSKWTREQAFDALKEALDEHNDLIE